EPWGRVGGSQPESVHLTRFPKVDESLIDEPLSRRMSLVLDLVALGRAARQDAKLRVRQPLREATVCVADEGTASELSDYLPLIEGELNVKQIAFAKDASRYVDYVLTPNFRAIGPRLGPLVQKLKGALATVDAREVFESLESSGRARINVDGDTVEL